ncbi:MAG: carboxypeptidase regulatory-like domain-containing protein, partial [Candidatus Thermoplasmatota archaeon]
MTEIHTMRVDGSNDQILFNGVIPGGLLYPMLAPKFSRDGSELTFYAWKGQYSQIWRIRSDGTNPRLVFNCEDWIEQFPQGNASFPSFSYDRTKIVFKFDPGPGPAEDAWPIVTYSDGSYFWRVAQGGEYFVYSSTNDRVAGEGGAYGYVGSCIAVTQNDNEYPPGQYPPYDVILYPWQDPYIQWVNWLRPLDWSPDGTKILLRDWAWPVGTASATGYYALGIVDVSTSQVSYVFGVDADGYYNNYNNVILQASFSPDGTKVVFDLSDGLLADGTAGKDFDIYTINADGTGKTKITNDKKSGLPTWGIRRGTIRGYVYTPDGFPIVEADVATGAKATTKTDALGMFALEALPWDNYNITISKPGYLTQTFQVPLSSSITTQNFTLTVTSPGNITGNVYIYGSATPIANATVSTRLGNYTVKTDFTGAFTISSVAPNPYNITANASGYRYQSTSVTVSPGATAICNIYLTPITIANWTYIVYLDGDNNLWQAGDNDYQEMQSVGSTDSVNIVVLKDNDWFGDTKLLVPNIGGATSTEIPLRYVNKSFSIELDMGSYLTLVDFVRWAIDNYPARYYALDLWDHGGGYTGMCWDDISGTHISVPDLKLAMISIATHLGRPIDVVVHDSCLMAELEADY